MNPKDKATECYCLEVKNKPLSSVPLGSYIIKWRRSSSADSQTLMSTVTFPPITVKHQAYTLSAGEFGVVILDSPLLCVCVCVEGRG